jgi:hypothetical protein
MVRIAPDETDELRPEPDPLGVAVGQVIACIFEALPTDCPERKAGESTHRRLCRLSGVLRRRAGAANRL